MSENNISLSKRTFMLFSVDPTVPIGTCFGIRKQSLVLTAEHVVSDRSHSSLIVVCTGHSSLTHCPVRRVERHPDADVAALIIDKNEALEHFDIGIPSDVYKGYQDYPLAEDVLAYGFPMLGTEKPIRSRMMKGHIQAHYVYTDAEERYRYRAYELAFPAFPGMSGSPVFQDFHNRNAAIAIVTDSISYSSETGNEVTRSDWAIGAALHPLSDWLESL